MPIVVTFLYHDYDDDVVCTFLTRKTRRIWRAESALDDLCDRDYLMGTNVQSHSIILPLSEILAWHTI